MPIILPIRELKNTATISKFVEETNEPVFITKNGYGSMVIMNLEVYERTFSSKGAVTKSKSDSNPLKKDDHPADGSMYVNESKSKYGK